MTVSVGILGFLLGVYSGRMRAEGKTWGEICCCSLDDVFRICRNVCDFITNSFSKKDK